MSCGLSFVGLCGTNILNRRLFLDTITRQDLPLTPPQVGFKREITDGICRKTTHSGEQDKTHIYPRTGVPLHRSPAVLAALSVMASANNSTGNEQQEDDDNASSDADLNQIAIDALQSFRPAPETSSKLAKDFNESTKAPSSLKKRDSFRMHPYTRTPVHVALEKGNVKGIHSSVTWPRHLTGDSKPLETQSLGKSFSSPDKLHLQYSQTSTAKTPSLLGNKMHGFAISSLSKLCMDSSVLPVARSSILSSHKSSVSSPGSLDRTQAPNSTQKFDNFRKLVLSGTDTAISNLSSRDLALQRLIADSLATHGICVIDGLLGNELAMKMKQEVLELHSGSGVVRGGLIGTGKQESNTRGDLITWVEGTEPICPTIGLLCRKMDRIVSVGTGVAPEHKICGGTKVMVARYPGGGTRYRLHVDNAKKDGRCLTCLYYLNQGWNTTTMGGVLRIHAQTSSKTANIAPVIDRLAVFYSDGRNPHEVLPCFADRYAVTLWYFDLDERTSALQRMDASTASTSR